MFFCCIFISLFVFRSFISSFFVVVESVCPRIGVGSLIFFVFSSQCVHLTRGFLSVLLFCALESVCRPFDLTRGFPPLLCSRVSVSI